jgi:nucleoside-diphosphate-sugar epimerase
MITGAAGGIGSRLSKRLYGQGHSLVLVDDLSGGFLENLGPLATDLKVADVSKHDMSEIAGSRTPDVVIHLAGKSSLAECESQPSEAFLANLVSTIRCADYAKSVGAGFIFSSTSAVYEGLNDLPFLEDMEVFPHLAYPLSKRAAEQYLEALSKKHGFHSLILRLFNVFGEGQNVIRVQPPFVNFLHRELSNGRVPIIYAPASQARDYVYIEDVIDFILLAINPDHLKTHGIYNVCSGRPITIESIIQAVALGAGLSGIEFQQGDPENFWNAFGELNKGPFPIKKSIVRNEVLKNSNGSPEKALRDFGWVAKRDVLREITSYASTLKMKKGSDSRD